MFVFEGLTDAAGDAMMGVMGMSRMPISPVTGEMSEAQPKTEGVGDPMLHWHTDPLRASLRSAHLPLKGEIGY